MQNEPMTVPNANDIDKNFLSLNNFLTELGYYVSAEDYFPAGEGGLSLKYSRTRAAGMRITKN